MKRSEFIKHTSLLSAGLLLQRISQAYPQTNFPQVRTPHDERKFVSRAVEDAIVAFKKNVPNKELAWLFENCFPNTLDTTVDFEQ